MKNKWSLSILVLATLMVQLAPADTVNIGAMKDNTLYEDNAGSLSNGQGSHFFAGRTAQGQLRRGLIAFDVASSVPPGATIDSVSLTLNMSRSNVAGDATVSLHRVLADWGEGQSDASGNEGDGDSSEPGDATWRHTFFPDEVWASLGGDFTPTASDSLTIGNTGFYTWGSTSQMVADVQQWLDDSNSNFGWLLLGEADAGITAKRFDTRENNIAGNRPSLRVDFTRPSITCDFSGDGLCDEIDIDLMFAVGPINPGVPAAGNEVFDLNGDGSINRDDRDEWLALAATTNGLGSPYKLGDANLDGFVDGQDFIDWNAHKFTESLPWSEGNFNGDIAIDGQDFIEWNANKFTSSDGVIAVPEPATGMLSIIGLVLLGVARQRP